MTMFPPPDEAIDDVLDWLRDIDRESKELLPLANGGDTGDLARSAIEALEMLREVQQHGWVGKGQ